MSDEGWQAPANQRVAIAASEDYEDKRSGTKLWLPMGEYYGVHKFIWLSGESVGIEEV